MFVSDLESGREYERRGRTGKSETRECFCVLAAVSGDRKGERKGESGSSSPGRVRKPIRGGEQTFGVHGSPQSLLFSSRFRKEGKRAKRPLQKS